MAVRGSRCIENCGFVAGNTVIFVTRSGILYAMDIRTGDKIWHNKMAMRIPRGDDVSHMSFHDFAVIDTITCLSIADGPV